MRPGADVVEEVRDQVEPDLGTLQRQIMSLRLYVISTCLEVRNRAFSPSRMREPVWTTGLLTLSCFQKHSQIIEASSGISTGPRGHRNQTSKVEKKQRRNKDRFARAECTNISNQISSAFINCLFSQQVPGCGKGS